MYKFLKICFAEKKDLWIESLPILILIWILPLGIDL